MSEVEQKTLVEDALADNGEPPKLSDEDMARVASYLNSPLHRQERKPFRPWFLLLFLMIVVTGLSVLSTLYAWIHGVPLQ
jgi:hypothetical protein